MTEPQPRPGMRSSPGAKLTPFRSARTIAKACGASRNRDPGVTRPVVAYKPGETIDVKWLLTIPHPSDVLNSGVRIAVHYDNGDSFEQNVLAGRLDGDTDREPVAAGPRNAARNSIQSFKVTLPQKTCDYCTLQWLWAAKNDGGSYVACADISITSDGTLPDFSTLPSQSGNTLPVKPTPAPAPPPPPAPSPAPPSGGAMTLSDLMRKRAECAKVKTPGSCSGTCMWHGEKEQCVASPRIDGGFKY